MRKIYSTTLLQQAELLRVALRRNGIECRLENEGGAMYAVGGPSPAVPIDLVVPEDDAELAARIIAEELARPHSPVPTELMQIQTCACGKTLEYPRGEEPPDECPWCGRLFRESPVASLVPPAGKNRASAALVTVLILGGILILGYRSLRSDGNPTRSVDDPDGTRTRLTRKLKERIAAIPSPELPRIDPDAIAAPLIRELPEEAARLAAALAGAAGVDALADRWKTLLAELAPDWATENGLHDSPRLERISAASRRKHTLLSALTLAALKKIPGVAATLDGRLFERHLERTLLSHLIFGSGLSDPRTGCWGVLASVHVLDRPALLAERLEQVPEVLAEIQRDLAQVPRLWIDIALQDINDAMGLLKVIERDAAEERLKAAVVKAREALHQYGRHLRTLREKNEIPGRQDPRWAAFLLRDLEFTDRTPRQAAQIALDESEKHHRLWNARDASLAPRSKSYGFPQWQQELKGLVAAAKTLTEERDFAEVPPGALPEVAEIRLESRAAPEWPSYGVRSFEATLRPHLWATPWKNVATSPHDCSPTTAFIGVLAETVPGRHLHILLTRRDASTIRRLYWSHSLEEGWHEYCRRWAAETVPDAAYDRGVGAGYNSTLGWIVAVEICHLAGTLTEQEAIEMLQSGIGESEESARARLGWATLEPLYGAGALLGAYDIAALRDEMKSKLGATFDLKRFHTRLLGYGKTPVALIREDLLRELK